ncbi:hypothetical protein [Spongiivirga citrea]|nr:hypothetical protein [Spongiivirga citrea]
MISKPIKRIIPSIGKTIVRNSGSIIGITINGNITNTVMITMMV